MLNRSNLPLIACALLLAGCNQSTSVKNLDTDSNYTSDDRIDWVQADRVCQNDVDPSQSGLGHQDYTGPDYSNLWNRIRSGYQLSDYDNDRVNTHLRWYARHTDYIERVTQRGNIYLYHIVKELEARGMPMELALLPIVESAFDPFAYSHGRAAGMWQFIPGTGKAFGLKQNWWYDGRRDVIASTDAAINYLSSLSKRFDDDWLLAMAAYNSGGGNVNKAIRKNKKAGKPVDYWSLDLPRETQNYIPKLIALSKIIKDPEHYKVKLAPIPNQPFFESVDTGSQIDLAQAANLADMHLDDLYKLNPGFNRWATDPEGPHRLLVPVEKADSFRSQLAKLPANSRIAWERYKIQSGDSLLAIARRHHTTVDVLREHNNIRGNLIRKGQMLLIPKSSLSAQEYAQTQSQRLSRTQANSKGKSGTRKVNYVVKSGDSLWSIARRHKVQTGQLAKWNGMAPKDTLKVNQKLVIWTPGQQLAQAGSSSSRDNAVVRKVSYRVRAGDSLARIAGKFNLSVNDIVKWNPVKKSGYIHPGQSLTLFVDVTRTN
ncbi:LysM peptidoglycan-binding domain-containing protein [Aestuariicella hydrocarbonica]|uniref:LysM peptidoglycan-binding domain-containing protein n=1 Tax=Pseudomaricurvus hydrocarbonicus TaxID=1470433 RepID=A0A9E5MLS5_9GAMM|nr:LysM peptidoglycan-binding domain-containing protein [Aestuariicella hydrocarbonica]NHO65363.1 LysM peptidoglycan-binding domain-containing protein [Aestuariicella hydrocarbonica]